MRILTIAATPYFSNRGCHIRIFSEAKYLQEKGNDVLLCTYHLGDDVGNFNIKRIGRTAWYGRFSPGFSWGKIWLDLKLLLLCIKEARKFKPDIIHAHNFEGLAIGYLMKKMLLMKNVPVVADLQGDLNSEFANYNKKQSLARNFFVLLSKIVIKWADWIVLSSENAKELLFRTYKQKENFTIINDGVDLAFFQNPQFSNPETESEIEKVSQWKGNHKVIFYAGGMEKSKGIDVFLNEFIRLVKESKDIKGSWKLIMFGEGSEKEEYKKAIKENGAEDNMIFTKETGFFYLPHFLRIADVGVDPKKGSTEGSGKLINYMAAGLPIICFDSDFNKERLKKLGLFLNEIKDLKALLLNFSKEEKLEYDLSEFSQGRQMEKFISLFESLK